MAEAVAPLRIRAFRALWTASVFSNLGSFLQSVAAAWLMLELTGSGTWVGLMVASNMLPLLFLALVAGAVADLVDRSKVLLASQAVMGVAAAAMALVSWADLATPELLLALGLLLGVGVAFNLPAWQAMVPDLVPRGMVASAVALNSVAFNVARAVGPALGGVLVATLGPEAGFGLNAVSYLGVIGVVAVVGRQLHSRDREETSVSSAIALGVRFARYTRPFRRLLGVAALFALTSAAGQAVLPNRTGELGGGALAYGLLLGAMGAGALVGALTRAPLTRRLGSRSVPATITLFGLAGVGLGLAPSLVAAVPALVVAGMCWVWTLATLNATAQLMAPAWVRGRAMSLYTLAFVGIFPLGSILAGVLADLLSPGRSITVLSLASAGVGVWLVREGLPVLDEVAVPEFSEDRIPPEHDETAEGGPVMILNTWVIDEADFDRFLEVMSEVRLVRLRTGAYRWRLYRNAGDSRRLTEAFLVPSWEEHLRQHRRIDDASAELIRRARAFDRAGGPLGRHLVAIDVTDPAEWPNWNELVADHRRMHASDGSVPLEESEPAPHRQ